MANKILCRGNIIEEYTIGATRIKINDAAIVARTRDDPKVQAIMERVAQIGLRVAEEAHAAGRVF